MNPITGSRAMRVWEESCFAAGSATPEELMLAAGNGAAGEFAAFCRALPPLERRRIVILAGHGNNGGDGIVMAQNLSRNQTLPVELFLTAKPEKLSATARHFFRSLSPKIKVHTEVMPRLQRGDVAVDALLGTGLSGTLREPYRSWIAALNQARVPVFSVDIPSGLGADDAVRADMTAAIGFFKEALFSAEGAACSGRLRRVPLPLPDAPEGSAEAVDAFSLRRATGRSDNTLHKYRKGSVLLLGGSCDYPFAPFLSARSALRAGAGVVRLLIPENTFIPGGVPLSLIVNRLPAERGFFDRDYAGLLAEYHAKADVAAIGPGMGRRPESALLVEQLCALDRPLVLDADALHFVSRMPALLRRRSAATLLTPHRGEAHVLARGAGFSLPDDAPTAARMLADAYGACIILKGRFSVTAAPGGGIWVNTSGCPALAAAGSGDCLTGVAAAFLAGDRAEPEAERAALAVFLHGLAGELAAEKFNMRGVIADDLPDLLPQAWRSVTFRA